MYKYEDLKPQLFTEDGMKKVLKARDNLERGIAASGAITMEKAIEGLYGDSWLQLAAVDYLVETGFIREVKQATPPMGQHRIFVKR